MGGSMSQSGFAFGRYQIKGHVGAGGMATVYRAYDPQFERDVAIKILPQQLMNNVEFRKRFQREARIIASLEHAAIVPVYDFGEEQGQPYFVMRLMTGGTLTQQLQRGALPLQTTLSIIRRICGALDKAHKAGIVHRDLKPANILFDSEGQAYLADFGIARLTQGTQTVSQLGTPHYMTPEQAKSEPLDARTDVYQMGVILFEMLSGRRPFDGGNSTAIVYQHVHQPPPRLSQFVPSLPASVETVVSRAIAKEPRRRFTTAGSLAISFQQALENTKRPAALPKSRLPLAIAGVICITMLIGLFAFPRRGTTLSNSISVQTTEQSPTTTAINPKTTTVAPTQVGSTSKAAPSENTSGQNSTLAEASPTSTINASITALELIPTATHALISQASETDCGLKVGNLGQATTNARLWSVPDVGLGQQIDLLDEGTALELVDGPEFGRIRQDMNIDGWWWLTQTPTGAQGWLWEERISGCESPATAGSTSLNTVPIGLPQPTNSTPTGQIVYTCFIEGHDDICILDLYDRTPRRLTTFTGSDWYASLSPSGNDIVYSSRQQGGHALYSMSSWGGSSTQLATAPQGAYAPVYSPDGRQIAYTHAEDGNQNVWLMNADGSNKRALTNHIGNNLDPVWSPDGTMILYASDRNNAERVYSHYTINTDGSNDQLIPDGLLAGGRADWSPDGNWYATYAHDGSANNYRQIFLVSIDGQQIYKLTTIGESLAPAFSPDGNWITFMSYRGGAKAEIYIMQLDGSQQMRITENNFPDYQPRWGP